MLLAAGGSLPEASLVSSPKRSPAAGPSPCSSPPASKQKRGTEQGSAQDVQCTSPAKQPSVKSLPVHLQRLQEVFGEYLSCACSAASLLRRSRLHPRSSCYS